MIRLLKRKEVERLTGLSRSSIYRAMQEGTFPHSIKIGGRSVAWSSEDIEQWIHERLKQSQEAF